MTTKVFLNWLKRFFVCFIILFFFCSKLLYAQFSAQSVPKLNSSNKYQSGSNWGLKFYYYGIEENGLPHQVTFFPLAIEPSFGQVLKNSESRLPADGYTTTTVFVCYYGYRKLVLNSILIEAKLNFSPFSIGHTTKRYDSYFSTVRWWGIFPPLFGEISSDWITNITPELGIQFPFVVFKNHFSLGLSATYFQLVAFYGNDDEYKNLYGLSPGNALILSKHLPISIFINIGDLVSIGVQHVQTFHTTAAPDLEINFFGEKKLNLGLFVGIEFPID